MLSRARQTVTEHVREHVGQQQLLASIQPKNADPDAEVIEEHRRNRRSHAKARQAVVTDFLTEVDRICRKRIPLHEKALHIREVLTAFERDEESLPENAKRILTRAERLSDVA